MRETKGYAAGNALPVMLMPTKSDSRLNKSLDHGHTLLEIKDRISRSRKPNLLRDTVYGAIDGTVTTFAIISGVAGAGLPSTVVIALGLANVLADGFSMAASNYLGTRSEAENHQHITQMENRHIQDFPVGETNEIREILKEHELTPADLKTMTSIITRYKSLWVYMMLTGEHGLAAVEPRPVLAAIATFVAFVACGVIPLLPFLVGSSKAYSIAIATTTLTFLIIGALKSRWSTESWFTSAIQTLAVGGSAAVIAYVAGTLVAA